jgi:molybdopterin molybdotransferase
MQLLPWREIARQAAALAVAPTRIEHASLHGAAGRVLAADVVAVLPLPSVDHAVMDGYVLGNPPPGRYRMLTERPDRLDARDALAVSAGDPVPEGAAMVVLAGRAERRDGQIVVEAPNMKNNIRRAGEEAKPGATILRAGTQLDARHMALTAMAGAISLPVWRRPRVALLGVNAGPRPLPHLGVMSALLGGPALATAEAGVATPAALPLQIARLAVNHEILVVIGDSLGDETGLLASAIAVSGGTTSLVRAAMKPAKPIHLGQIGGARIIGLSGTAYAVTVASHLFLRPLLQAAIGLAPGGPLQSATAAFARPREPGRAEALPVRADWRDGGLTLALAGRFGQLSALAAMDGFALVSAEARDLREGDAVAYQPLKMPLV